jgi:hypothetical protein
MGNHPYKGQPDFQFWKSASGARSADELDPVVTTNFAIKKDDKIVTAGSCFAGHLAQHLAAGNFTHFVTEPGHPAISAELRRKYNYGVFSARYGNIYTGRQLRQLLERAYGIFHPVETHWRHGDNAVIDPFRPQIQPNGFLNVKELLADQSQHFSAVRLAIETMDYFVFTLGLTEAWIDRRDGAVLPLAPGVAGGVFDPDVHQFHNFTVDEVVQDIDSAFTLIRQHNTSAKFLLTVSPVPLNATAMARHILVSTTYSKAVLRVAAEYVCAKWDNAEYFPSYEIITAPHVRGRYFATDHRSVLDEGVEHVMRVFFRHYSSDHEALPLVVSTNEGHICAAEQKGVTGVHLRNMESLIQVLCDEEAITNS